MGKCLLSKNGGNGLDPDTLTATSSDVLKGKMAGVSGSDEPISGTMPNNGAVSQSLNAGGSYTIPAGYHNGSGKVTANSLSSQTSANATANQILSGQTAWVNGSKVTGSMPNRGTVNQSLGINGSYTIPSGYHNGSGKITQSVATQGGSTTTPGTSNKTIVSANRYVSGNIIVAGSSNLTAGNIKKGVNIFGVTGSWEGYIANPTDLYKYGINRLGFRTYSAHSSTALMDSNQIKLQAIGYEEDEDDSTSYSWNYAAAISSSTINLTAYSTLTLTYYVYYGRDYTGSGMSGFIKLGTSITSPTNPNVNFENVVIRGDDPSSTTIGQKTLSLNISAVNATKYIAVQLGGYKGYGFGIYVYQISLS